MIVSQKYCRHIDSILITSLSKSTVTLLREITYWSTRRVAKSGWSMNVFLDKLSQILSALMPDWWNTYTLSHLLVLISWGCWNRNSMRKILVATTNEVTKTWRRFTAQALRAPKLKTDYKNLSLGTASLSLKPPWLVAAKNAKQILESLFLFLFENKVWVDTFLVQTFASTFDATQIDFHAQGYDCSKAWRRVNWSPVFEFLIQTTSGIQKDTNLCQ